MDSSLFFRLIEEKDIEYRKNECMAEHTTFKIGGNADLFLMPETAEEISYIIKKSEETKTPLFAMGKGSNILVSDKGIKGAVLSLERLNFIQREEHRIICGAGASLSAVCVFARDNGLSGLEFAYGIPGSVGGGLFMNAGAYGGEMSDVVKGAYCIDRMGNEIYIDVKDMDLSYRHSIFKGSSLVITKIVFELIKGKYEEINGKMQELLLRRKTKQPLDYPSAGSTFKRPKGNFAGTLIEKNGLKGKTVGGAMVSEKHAGFVINYKNASSQDVLRLIEEIKTAVYEGDGVMLEPEVIFVGRR